MAVSVFNLGGTYTAPVIPIGIPVLRKLIYDYYLQNDDVSSALDIFLARTLAGGIEVSIKIEGKERKLRQSGETLDYYNNDIIPMVRNILRELIFFGYVVLVRSKSLRQPEFPVAIIPPENSVELRMTWKRDMQRIYRPFYTGLIDHNRAGKPIRDHELLILDAPLDDGRLTSRMVRLIRRLMHVQGSWTDYEQASADSSRPSYIFTPDSSISRNTAEQSGGPLGSIWFADGNVRGPLFTYEHYRRQLNRTEQMQLQDALLSAEVQNRTSSPFVSSARAAGADPSNQAEDRLSQRPWNKGFTAPIGHRLQSGIMPRGPESFMQLQEVHTRSILSSLGVPADIRSTSQRFAANVEFIMQELGDNVKDFHRRVKPLLEKAFAFVWRQLIRNKVVQKSKKQLEKGFPRPMKSPVEVVLTFNYNPSIANKQLVRLQDSTAKLSLNATTLNLTTTGLQLTKGILEINGTCPVNSDATVAAEGFEFGDGSSTTNNVTVKTFAESGLDVQSGFVVYKNV